MERGLGERFGNVAAFALVILFNYLANAIPLGGQSTGAISDRYVSMFTPAGFTFSIWGVIYITLFGFIIRQLFSHRSGSAVLSRLQYPFIINCVANAGWIVAWHYDYLGLSMVIMVVLFLSLFKISEILNQDFSPNGVWDRLLIVLPFQIYFGWITVATIANISIIQSATGLNEFLISQQAWTIFKLLAAASAAYYFGWKSSRPAYLFVIAWASFGISIANSGQVVIYAFSTVLAGLCAIAGILSLTSNWKHNKLMATNVKWT